MANSNKSVQEEVVYLERTVSSDQFR